MAAENSMKEGQQRHAKNLKRLLGIIRHSKMLIEILQSRLCLFWGPNTQAYASASGNMR